MAVNTKSAVLRNVTACCLVEVRLQARCYLFISLLGSFFTPKVEALLFSEMLADFIRLYGVSIPQAINVMT
jgi:hypothetical protein